MRRLRERVRGLGWATLHSEPLRGVLGLLAGLAVTVGAVLALEAAGAGSVELTELLFLGMAAYLSVYVVLTLLAFSRTRWSVVERWARARRPVHWTTRVVTASEPGPGVAVTYAVAYLLADVRAGGTALGFPGEEGERRTFTDYPYFSLSVSSTFGPTDVQVRSTRMRRLVAGHGVTAFAFNTVILGAGVSMLVALR